MKKPNIILLLLMVLACLAACHKDKEMDVKEAVVSNEEMTVADTQARFSWQVDFAGQFQTGVEVSQNENMADLKRVEASKQEDKFVAVVDSLTEGKKYYYRIVVWNKFGSYAKETKDFRTKEKTLYLIKASCLPTEGGLLIGAGQYEEGQYCTLKAICNEGYDFVNWTENGAQVSTQANYTFKVTQNRNLVAKFAKQRFTVSVSPTPSVGGSVSGGGEYEYGQSCTVSASAAVGFTFSKWMENGTQVSANANYTFTVNNSRSLVANFTELQSDEFNINVTANPSDGGSVTGGGAYHEGASCTVTATANEGYTFANWTEEGEVVSTNEEYTFTVDGNRTLVANFTAQNYTISVSANPTEGGTVIGGGTYQYGQSCTVSAMANNGFTFNNWTENGNVVYTAEDYEFTVTGNRTLVTNFTAQSSNNYTINVSANPPEGGTVSGDGTYQEGQSCTVVATASDGYTFTNWTENGSVVFTDANYTFTVTCNRTLVANFSVLPPNTYNINVSANPPEGGTMSGGGTYQEGQSSTVVATANEGYTFTNWTENGNVVFTDASYTFTVTCNRTLVANFSVLPPNTYNINVSANPPEGGTVSGGGTYQEGQSCTVVATANVGYTFTNWTENGVVASYNRFYTFTVDCNHILVANFTPETYTVNVMAFPSNGGTVSGGGTYTNGEMCTLQATAAVGYSFLFWANDYSVVSTDASYTFTVTNDRHLVAHFLIQTQAPPGAVNGVFSISTTEQVWFSQGNLQYIGSASTPYWKFADNQWDYLGTTTSQNNTGQNVDRDLFGWGTSGWNCGNTYYYPWDCDNTNGSLYGPPGNYDLTDNYANSDWGVYNPISNGGSIAGKWYTFSSWYYLLYNRPTLSGIRFAKAQVNNVNGVVLLPDNWSSNYYSLNNTNDNNSNFSSNVIDSSTWTNLLQSHGAVFLPAAGNRSGTGIYYNGNGGYYWSVFAHYNNSSKAISLYFNETNINTYSQDNRFLGHSVRLVYPVEN